MKRKEKEHTFSLSKLFLDFFLTVDWLMAMNMILFKKPFLAIQKQQLMNRLIHKDVIEQKMEGNAHRV